MKKKRLIIDLDETLRPFVKPFLNCYNKKFGANIKEEDILTYEMHKYLPEVNNKEKFKDFIIEFAKEIYLDPEPYTGVREALKELSNEYDLLIVTAAPSEVHSYILKWQKDKDIDCPIVFDSDKTKYKGYAIIDDCPYHLENNSCEITICIERKYNEGIYTTYTVDNISEIIPLLNNKERLYYCRWCDSKTIYCNRPFPILDPYKTYMVHCIERSGNPNEYRCNVYSQGKEKIK